MAINARFSTDGGEHMVEKYIGMGVSKLQEMLGLPDEELEKVTKETTVREIRAMKAAANEPLYRFLDPTVFGTNFRAFRNRYAVMGGFDNRQIIGYKDLDKLIQKEHSIAYAKLLTDNTYGD